MQLVAVQRAFAPEFVSRLCACAEEVFPSRAEPDEIAWRLEQMPDAVVHVAEDGSRLLGFKIAYATRRRRLYSWLGGVVPAERRQGVARALMQAQHGWARERGYSNVETGTVRNNLAMLSLDLQSGFRIIGTYSRGGTIRVLMTKRL